MFTRKQAEPEPEMTGTEFLRRTVRARNKTPTALVNIANEIGVGVAALENFGHGRGELSAEAKAKLARLLYQTGSYDAETDRLKSIGPEPTSIGIVPPPVIPNAVGEGYPPVVDPKGRSSFSPGPIGKPYIGKRPGWE